MANGNKPSPASGNKAAPAAAKAPPPAKREPIAEADKKSIVPSKYAGKYKDGGQGPTSEFIKEQCSGKEGFEFPAFFTLARKNGIDEAKVATYEQQVNEGTNGANGRARMTIGNMLRAIARKNQKLKGINGKDVDVAEAKLEVKGAAKAAQDKKAA